MRPEAVEEQDGLPGIRFQLSDDIMQEFDPIRTSSAVLEGIHGLGQTVADGAEHGDPQPEVVLDQVLVGLVPRRPRLLFDHLRMERSLVDVDQWTVNGNQVGENGCK